ncbi:MAG: hypothetical protein NT026_02605, partial [Candidatus Staskawiczbacteria bacterium]|nr:hypothetical protein [Candidatus Staskawiczbacteria bacterium]
MLNFSSILKHKKIFTFIFIFLVVSGLIIPQISHAGFFDWLFSNNCGDASTAATQAERDAAMACLRGEN